MSLYNVENTAWMLKYGTIKFLPYQMKSILVKTWEYFKV